MSILLIQPSKKIFSRKDIFYRQELLSPSLGLASIYSYSVKNGIDCNIIDFRLKHIKLEYILEYIKNNNPIFVGISAFTDEIGSAGELANHIKKNFPEVIIVVGGVHVTLLSKETLEEFRNIDIVIIGEGEETTVELYRHIKQYGQIELERIKGLAFRKDGKIFITEPRPAIEDLNSLPITSFDGFEIERYSGIFAISISRGCPYRCYFCAPFYLGQKLRMKTPNRVVDEIDHLLQNYSVKRIQFADASFGIDKSIVKCICEELIRRGINKKLNWDCEARADSLDKDLLVQMKKAGCGWIALGVESGNEKILQETIKKGETKEDIRKAISLIKGIGIGLRCFFTIGHCSETEATINETIDFALELKPDAISFGLLVPYPGTEFRRLAEERKSRLKIISNNWDDYSQFNFNCCESDVLPLEKLKYWQSKAYFTFYSHYPLKIFKLLFEKSSYSYRPYTLFKIPFLLLKNIFWSNRN